MDRRVEFSIQKKRKQRKTKRRTECRVGSLPVNRRTRTVQSPPNMATCRCRLRFRGAGSLATAFRRLLRWTPGAGDAATVTITITGVAVVISGRRTVVVIAMIVINIISIAGESAVV